VGSWLRASPVLGHWCAARCSVRLVAQDVSGRALGPATALAVRAVQRPVPVAARGGRQACYGREACYVRPLWMRSNRRSLREWRDADPPAALGDQGPPIAVRGSHG